MQMRPRWGNNLGDRCDMVTDSQTRCTKFSNDSYASLPAPRVETASSRDMIWFASGVDHECKQAGNACGGPRKLR